MSTTTPRTVYISFTSKFKVENAVFVGGDLQPECVRILRQIADRLESSSRNSNVYDKDGNVIGSYSLGANDWTGAR